MPTTRKKVIKTVYKDENDSEADADAGDFSDSGSEAVISQPSSSDEDEEPAHNSSEDDKKKKKSQKSRSKTTKRIRVKNQHQMPSVKQDELSPDLEPEPIFSVKDLTEADKQLPSILNLSESDSSDDEAPKIAPKAATYNFTKSEDEDSEMENSAEYKDVWSSNMKESEEIAKRTFLDLEKHKNALEETKQSIQMYTVNRENKKESDVNHLLALGEEVISTKTPPKTKKSKGVKTKDDSESEIEDWEEVAEGKAVPQQGLQLIVDFPDAMCRKTKKVDVEMMMKRKINRVKKEYQVYMHKVHVLCWLGHGNYISQVLNDQDVLSAALSLIPSKESYPGERVDMKYVEQITTWFKDKLTVKFDKNEGKFRPKAPPLKNILIQQIQNRVVTSKKYIVYIFVSMLRAVGLQCRIMLNFTTLPIKPPSTELCSLSTKPKLSEKQKREDVKNKDPKNEKKKTIKKGSCDKIPQLDGNNDSLSDNDFDNIMQVDGNDDGSIEKQLLSPKGNVGNNNVEDVSPPKKPRRNLSIKKISSTSKGTTVGSQIGTKANAKTDQVSRKSLSLNRNDLHVNIEQDNKFEERKTTNTPIKNLSLRKVRNTKNEDNLDASTNNVNSEKKLENLPKKNVEPSERKRSTRTQKRSHTCNTGEENKQTNTHLLKKDEIIENDIKLEDKKIKNSPGRSLSLRRVKNTKNEENLDTSAKNVDSETKVMSPKKVVLTNESSANISSEYFTNVEQHESKKSGRSRKHSHTSNANVDNTKTDQVVTKDVNIENVNKFEEEKIKNTSSKRLSLRRVRNRKNEENLDTSTKNIISETKVVTPPKIIVTTNEPGTNISSEYFDNFEQSENKTSIRTRKRSHTSNPNEDSKKTNNKEVKRLRGKSAPANSLNKSKYFDENKKEENVCVEKVTPLKKKSKKKIDKDDEDADRVSHRDLVKPKLNPKNDVTNDLVNIIKKRVREAKVDVQKGVVVGISQTQEVFNIFHSSKTSVNTKGKSSVPSDEDSDYLPEITEQQKSSALKKLKAKPGTSRKIDRRVLSTDDEIPSAKVDTWCEIFVEELEQWVAVDIIKGRVHCVNEIYRGATHPVTYIVGWDNNNYLKDLTRRYVPQWNTVTRKQRVDPMWWNTAIKPWLGPRTARDKEEDEKLDRMQLDAPLPKSIAEYKNHPLYALKRHLLKFEAIYPPDAATLGFVRGEPVYARECVYVCRSRDTWLKEAKVVRLGEQPYKVVKARPKWDKLSNKLITDKPLEVFGPWQVQDYEPPVAENGIVPRNAYGNVELFKQCMLPKGTVHIKLPGLNRVAKKLNIDCAPAMTGFDFNGGWSHPVFDGFVVCKEFEEIITSAWHEDQEEQERKELEKIEARVYGNWKRLIKGLLIRERLKLKYGFSEPTTSQDNKKKSAGPRLTIKKKF